MITDDDLLEIIDDTEEFENTPRKPAWRILIVDDDEGVHAASTLALNNVDIYDRPLELHHCYSAKEARSKLLEDKDFAVILLDVVMESERAGLEMISFIRDEVSLKTCRIILRTGQPGYAPELNIFNDYDIDDYRTKSELTRTRLITCITAALRSYRQITALGKHREGLEKVIAASSDLMEKKAIHSFAEGILTQLASLMSLQDDGIVCAQRSIPIKNAKHEQLYIVGAVGTLTHYISRPIFELKRPDVMLSIQQCLDTKNHIFDDEHVALYLQSSHMEGVIYLHTGRPLGYDEQRLIEVFATNISSCYGNVQLVDRLNYVAYHDSLTRLPNRTRFILELDKVAQSQNTNTVVALLDISHFADLNEGLGIDAGNTLLQAVASRLTEEVGSTCFIARTGADVFGLIGPQHAINSNTIESVFLAPFMVEQMAIQVRFSAGFCRLLYGEMKGLTLLKRANIALTRSKKSTSRSYEYFMEDMENDTRWRIDIIQKLHRDFYNGQLELWYQPQINLKTGVVCGLEALMRWPDEQGGFVQPPSVFIPLAEYSGLIVELGDWALEESCKLYKSLAESGLAPASVSVNVSVPQFKNPAMVKKATQLVSIHQMPQKALNLEITESLAMDDPQLVIESLLQLRKAGIQTSIDDFGTGYSSLGYLRKLSIDCLKIDQGFIQEIVLKDGQLQGGVFADTIVTLGDKLNLRVVAEGVETQEQARFLRQLGCEVAQGFFYAKPMPEEALYEWLRTYRPITV